MKFRSYTLAAAFVWCLAFGPVLGASSFTLGHNPNQLFDWENVGPYPGILTGSTSTNFFCLDYTLTSSFGANYVGAVAVPTTQAEEEAAFLGAYAIYKGSPSSTPNEVNLVEGPISFAIWQIMGTMGTTAPDPAARQYIQTAQYAYSHNLIPQAFLDSVLIFEPTDNRIQRMITAMPDNAMVSSTLASEAVPEPGTMVLVGGALLLLASAIAIQRRRERIKSH